MSIKSLFPGLPLHAVRPYPFYAVFEAELLAGFYTWNNLVSLCHEAQVNDVFYIQSLRFSANIKSEDFTNALDQSYNSGKFDLQILQQFAARPITQNPISFSQFSDSWPVDLAYKCQNSEAAKGKNQGKERVNFSLTGRLLQTPELIVDGKDTIRIVISGMAYRITDQNWIKEELK